MKELINFDTSGATGVSVNSLGKSRKFRKDFLVKFGEVPTSILKYDRGSSLKFVDLVHEEMEGGHY